MASALTRVSDLPRLLYLGDVPVEASYHGSALLHRLLSDWPADKLLVAEPSYALSQTTRRLEGVPYRVLPFGISRLMHSRLANAYGAYILATAKSRCSSLQRVLGGFEPQAVLSVTHGYSWITASRFAEQRAIPLHLICHDDWLLGLRVVSAMKPSAEAQFATNYRKAASRLCVSPGMEEKYRSEYGSDGSVLYPSRAADCPTFTSPPSRRASIIKQPIVAFAGTVNGPGYVRALCDMAEVLQHLDGRLLVYGPLSKTEGEAIGIRQPNVEFRGLIRSQDLILRLREETDFLYLPMSFHGSDRSNMEISFPSKLTDYTAVGVPILIRGPEYCSAIRWARRVGLDAGVIGIEDQRALAIEVARFCGDPSLREAVGAEMLAIGERFFSRESAVRMFHSAVGALAAA